MQILHENSHSPLGGRRVGLKGKGNTCWKGVELRGKLLSGVMVGGLPFEGLSGHAAAAIQILGFLFYLCFIKLRVSVITNISFLF